MDFAEAQRRYRELRDRYEGGFLKPEQFQALVEELSVQDGQGRWWTIGVKSGKWYVNQEGQWVEAQPPGPAAEKKAPRVAPPAGPSAEGTLAGETIPSAVEPPMDARQATIAAPIQQAPPVYPTYPPPLPVKAAPGRRWPLFLALGVLGLVAIVIAAAALLYFASRQPKPPPSPGAVAQATATATPTAYVATATAIPGKPTPTPTLNPLVKAISPTAKATETPAVPPSLEVPATIEIAVATPTATPLPTVAAPTDTPLPTVAEPSNTPARPTPKPRTSGGLNGKLAFSMLQNTQYKVYVVQLPAKTYIASIGNARQPSLRSDGKRLAVNGSGGGGMETIWSMSPEGQEAKEVTCYTTNSHPFWSPDGLRLVFDDAELDPRGGRIYIQKVDERNCELHKYPLTAVGTPLSDVVGGAGSYMFPLWSADNRIVFRGCDTWTGGGSQCGLWAVNPDGSKPTQVTSNPQHIPTDTKGKVVAFMSAESGNWEVYTVGLGGGGPRNLTNNKARDGLPTISPDGQLIAFISDRDGKWAVWVMGVDGSNPQKLMDFNPDMGAIDEDSWTLERMSWSP
jgi:hypothetical protein